MKRRVFIRGTGTVTIHGTADIERLTARLAEASVPFERRGHRVRLIHRIEEVAFLAAAEALASGSHPSAPWESGSGIVLGIDEGIDDIKADHWRAVLAEGPLGASPLHFPFTAPNAVTGQLTIYLELAGETATVCGGVLSGAEAIGLAAASLRDGRCGMMLAGGATSVCRTLAPGIDLTGRGLSGSPRDGAGFLLLGVEGTGCDAAEILGYGEGRGEGRIAAAISRCLAEAQTEARSLSEAVCAGGDPGETATGIREAGLSANLSLSDYADMHSAAFPLAIAGALRERGNAGRPFLAVATDRLGGAAAILVKQDGTA